jgi:hypothetical protein
MATGSEHGEWSGACSRGTAWAPAARRVAEAPDGLEGRDARGAKQEGLANEIDDAVAVVRDRVIPMACPSATGRRRGTAPAGSGIPLICLRPTRFRSVFLMTHNWLWNRIGLVQFSWCFENNTIVFWHGSLLGAGNPGLDNYSDRALADWIDDTDWTEQSTTLICHLHRQEIQLQFGLLTRWGSELWSASFISRSKISTYGVVLPTLFMCEHNEQGKTCSSRFCIRDSQLQKRISAIFPDHH